MLALLLPYFSWCFVIAPFITKKEVPSLVGILTNTDMRYWFVYLLFFFSAFYYVGQQIKRGWKGVLGGGDFVVDYFRFRSSGVTMRVV